MAYFSIGYVSSFYWKRIKFRINRILEEARLRDFLKS